MADKPLTEFLYETITAAASLYLDGYHTLSGRKLLQSLAQIREEYRYPHPKAAALEEAGQCSPSTDPEAQWEPGGEEWHCTLRDLQRSPVDVPPPCFADLLSSTVRAIQALEQGEALTAQYILIEAQHRALDAFLTSRGFSQSHT